MDNESKGEETEQVVTNEEERINKDKLEKNEHDDKDVEEDDEEEQPEENSYCNPMVSDSEDIDEDESLRGDRLGSTTYSQRHVLKILINWTEKIQKLSKVSNGDADNQQENNGETDEKNDEKVTNNNENMKDFLEDMSLLWDMSTENDVIEFLVDNGVLPLIKSSLDFRDQYRLRDEFRMIEISLGILANLLSSTSIIERFVIIDDELELINWITNMVESCPELPILLQVFAIIRRIVWFIRNVNPYEKWLSLLLDAKFLKSSNFILSSSTNGLLLGEVIIIFSTLIELLSPELIEGNESEKDSKNEENKPIDDEQNENYKSFYETNFIPSVCEAFSELFKDKSMEKVLNKRKEITTASGFREEELYKSPPGHIQRAILNGASSLYYLNLDKNGKKILSENKEKIISFLLKYFDHWKILIEDISDEEESNEYFCKAITLFGSLHLEYEKAKKDAISVPLYVYKEMVKHYGEKIFKTSLIFKNVIISVNNYLKNIEEKFGIEALSGYVE